jgi:hypothetical protein
MMILICIHFESHLLFDVRSNFLNDVTLKAYGRGEESL